MNDSAIETLIEGYRQFKEQYIGKQYGAYRVWAGKTQTPRIMMISCSDSRVNPAILTHAGLGELFMVNNVANLVPPYKEGKDTHHSTSSALEYAITVLEVEDIIILGHSGCGGIKALIASNNEEQQEIKTSENAPYSFIGPWVQIAAKAKESVLTKNKDLSLAEQQTLCEKEALLVSLENLETFPWVKAALSEDKLKIHAWHFDIESGDILYYNSKNSSFIPLQ